ncbi:MAG: hypothetical protein QM489_02575 [Candidatus Izemoplasma sp.]
MNQITSVHLYFVFNSSPTYDNINILEEGVFLNFFDKIGRWIVITFALLPIGILVCILTIINFASEPIYASLILIVTLFMIIHSIYWGAENKYKIVITVEDVQFQRYPFFFKRHINFFDIKKLELLVDNSGIHGKSPTLRIVRKGFKKSLLFSSFGISKRDDFDNFLSDLSHVTVLEINPKICSEFKKMLLMVLK